METGCVCVCVCVRARARVRACVRARAHNDDDNADDVKAIEIPWVFSGLKFSPV